MPRSFSRTVKFLIPVIAFAVLFVFLLRGLDLKPAEVPSPLIGKPAPAFTLPQLGLEQTLSPEALRGKVWLLNVWASWCAACRDEHPLLMQMAQDPRLVMVGMAYKDEPADSTQWLQEHGNPYRQVIMDHDGRVGIDYGVYGVPETFVIDAKGIIRYKQIGALTAVDLKQHVLPLLEEKS